MKYDVKEIIETWVPRLRKLKIRQYKFAELADVHPAQLSQYVSERVTPTIASFEKIENKIHELERSVQ